MAARYDRQECLCHALAPKRFDDRQEEDLFHGRRLNCETRKLETLAFF